MIQDYRDKSCLVHDNGLFVELAVLLSKHFGKTYYYSPWECQFPRSNQTLIGKGIPGVTRVDDPASLRDIDLYVFPDIYCGGLQLELEAKGKRVWGSRKGEELEIYRDASKKHLKKLGIDIGDYEGLTGIQELREHLKAHDDQWVKISRTRGDMESFHSPNYKLIEPKLDELEHSLGARKKTMEFIVEDGIDGVEIAYDAFSVDGQYPKMASYGIEIKDRGYLGVFCPYISLPKQIRDVNRKISTTLAEYHYRNFISLEMRVTESGTPYVIDPCCRLGSPPSELALIMISNLPDILWFGAEGKCIDPVPAAKYGAELLIHSAWADKNWQAISFPPEIREHVKLRNLTIIDNEYYVVPQSVGLPEIGAVVATGNTVGEAIDHVKSLAERIEGYYIDIHADSLDQAQEEISKLNRLGMRF